MHRFIMSKDWAEQLGKAARTDVKERFNSSIFKQDLNYLVMKGNVMKYSAFLEEIPSDTSFNSHSVRTQRSPSSVFES